MSNELVKSNGTALQVAVSASQMGEETFASDFKVPRIQLLQSGSKLVKERQGFAGDIVKTSTKEKLPDDKGVVKFIPLMVKHRWKIEQVLSGNKTFAGFEERTAQNEALPWEFMKDGIQCLRTKVLEVFCLLPQDIEADMKNMEAELPDLDKVLLPCVLSFQSTSFAAGQEVITLISKIKGIRNRFPNLRMHHYTMTLSAKLEENKKGSYFKYLVSGNAEKTKAEYLPIVEKWANILTSRDVAVEPEESEEASQVSQSGGETEF